MATPPSREPGRPANAIARHDPDADYEALLDCVRKTFAATSGQPLFRTDAVLEAAFLDNLGDERQSHACSACRHFLKTFGGLVTIGEDGRQASALWDAEAVPAFYRPAVSAMQRLAARAAIVTPFLSPLGTWGKPRTGTWTHFAVTAHKVHARPFLTAGQVMAARRADHGTVARALADFTPQTIAAALRLLESGQFARNTGFIAPLRWLADLQARRGATRDKRARDNILWRAIATAPPGFCHPRAAVTGTLLEDIAAGMAFQDVKARFDAKVHALRYQRPQAAPAAGNLAEAERIVQAMGLAPALERRFARLDELQTAWTPPATTARPKAADGVFSHIQPKGAAPAVGLADAPAVTMTWEKFARTVMPEAEAIEALVLPGRMNFITLTTATNPEAPIIFKWDNPVAWYVYQGGAEASAFNLEPGWVKVNAIAPLPPMWGDRPKPHLGEGMVLVLDGCRDTGNETLGLFPECLIGELHGVRSVIEAHSRAGKLSGAEQASACGLDVRHGTKAIGYRLRVTTGGLATEYELDRWD